MEKELKELTAELNAKMDEFAKTEVALKELEKTVNKKADAEQIEKLQTTLDKSGEDITKLNEEIEKMGALLKDNRDSRKSASDYLKEAVSLDFLKKSMGKNVSSTARIDTHPMNLLKVATMTEHTNLTFGTANTNSVVLPYNEAGVSKAPDRQVYLVDLFNVATISSPRVMWVERSARTDGAATRAENAIMGQSDYTWIRRNVDVENISTYVKTTDEALADWDQTLAQIRIEIFGQLSRELDDQLLAGDGSTPNISGVTALCRTYDFAGLDDYVPNPEIFDAILAAITQVRYHLYNPNYVVLHPTDYAKMMFAKDANNNYILPPFLNGLNVDGVSIVTNSGITAGQVLVGDFTKGTVYFRKGIDIRLWDQNETDPIYGLKTITGDMRATLKLAQPDYYAFCYDAISDITSAISKP